MTWINPSWVTACTFAGLDEQSWSYFGVVELWGPHHRLLCGLLVDSPRYAERDLYATAHAAVLGCGFDGRAEGLPAALARVSDAIVRDPVAQRTGKAQGLMGGVHAGGLAVCDYGRLASFRVGRFRIEAGGQVLLPERTMLTELLESGKPRPPDKLIHMVQSTDACLPRERIEAQLRWHDPGSPAVTVEHHKTFGLPSSARISLRARWVPA